MGASGAGKTTLLNVLNYRNRANLQIEGEIRLNGQLIKSSNTLAAVSGYVQQEDLFYGTLTVKEHLKFQAMLRMDKEFTKRDRMQRIEQVMNDVRSIC
jgi:ATP-binding cassette, subfamily G (WHITE), eye pigment precursor transporter